MATDMAMTGGCQCGAVRYRAEAPLANAHLCHCRMCQKAAGNYFLPLASIPVEALRITRGEIAWFASSDLVRRGFCSRCGTPLAFDPVGSGHIALTLGALDHPEAVVPEWQSDMEAAVPFHARLAALPRGAEEADPGPERQARYEAIRLSSHQHPDHDTETWPPQERTMP